MLLFLRILFTRFWLTFRAHPLVAVGSLTIAAGLFTVLRAGWHDRGTSDTVAAAVVAAWALPVAVAWLTAAASVGETSPTLPALGAAAGFGIGVALAHAALATLVALVTVLSSLAEDDGLVVVLVGPLVAICALAVVLVGMLAVVPPVLFVARVAGARNLDLRDRRAFLGAALLALVNALVGGAYVGFVRASALPLQAVVAGPLLVALGADAPFFGPGEAPTHALCTQGSATYRTTPEHLGYFAQR